jgi:signal transduction histidine kinase
MRLEELILAILAVTSSAIAVYLWRNKVALSRQVRSLTESCRATEAENDRLKQSLSARDHAVDQRMSRLEHDLKSPLGVILGFSTLLREFAQGQSLPALPLRCISGIDQASRKMLRIIEAAAQGPESESQRDETPDKAMVQGKAS